MKKKININQEEKELNNRLKQLEEKYKTNLFSGEIKGGAVVSEKVEEIETPTVNNEIEEEPEQQEITEIFSEKKIMPVKKFKQPIFKFKKPKVKVSSKAVIENKVGETLPEVLKGEARPTEAEVKKCSENVRKMKKEMAKILIGQGEIVDGMLRGLLCNGHVLIEGVPGIAKTLAIRALSVVSGCNVERIQFTVDLLPTDIIGITTYTPKKGFEVIKGPIFANFLIADEINRSPPKTQSALIEGMQERQATIGRETYKLPSPFFVMATVNPLESAGVYPLPEAQIDRFLFKIIMKYPKEKDEMEIMEYNMSLKKFEDFGLKKVIVPTEIIKMQEIVKKIYLDDSIKKYILEIVKKSRNKQFKDSEYLTYGGSPRASIGLFIASKARALMNGRNYVIPEDVKSIAFEILRHRLILSYKATLKQISPDDIIKNILNEVKIG